MAGHTPWRKLRHKSGRGIRFHFPNDVTIDVGLADLELLRDELEKIADGAPRLAAAAALARRLDSLTVPLGQSGSTFEPDPAERYALLRATNHLSNLGRDTRTLRELRDMLAGTGDVRWVAYELRFHSGRGLKQDFTSYSLAYEADDRLVDSSGEELRVVEVREGDPAELVVDAWRPAE